MRTAKIVTMAFLLAVSCGLTVYFHAELELGTIFTHFFYVPIILACIWWRRRGLLVAVFLATLLIVSHLVFRPPSISTNDYFRAFMFMAIGLVVAVLSERIAGQHDLLQKSEAHFQRMVAGIPGMVYRFLLHPDGSMSFPFISEGCKEFFDVSPEEVQRNAEAFLDLMPSEDRTAFRRSVATSAESLSLLDFSGQAIVAEEEKWFRALARPERQPNGDTLWNGVFVDISDIKQAERIKHLNAVLRAIRDVNQLIVREKDRGRLLQSACENLIATRGYRNAWIVLLDKAGGFVTAAESGLGAHFLPMIERLKSTGLPPCGRKALKQSGFAVTADPSTECIDCPLSGVDIGGSNMAVWLKHGDVVYGVLAVSIPAKLAKNAEEEELIREVAGDIAFALHDIELTRQHEKAEEALARSEAKFRILVEQMPAVTYTDTLDEAGTTTYISPQVESFLGVSPDVYLKSPDFWSEHLHPDDRERVLSEVAKCHETNEPFRSEYRMVARSGDVIWIHDEAVIVRDADGTPLFLQGVMLNITDRKRVEEALRESEEQYRAIFESASDILLIFDFDGNIVEANPAACVAYGYSHEVMIGLNGKDIVHPEHYHMFEDFKQQVKTTGQFFAESVDVRKDGSTFDVEVRGSTIAFKGKSHLMAMVRDITEHKQMEEQLRQSQKMEAIGHLAGGVAHDFRNQLTVIKGFTESLLRRSLVVEEGRDKIAEILKAVERSTKLTGQLLVFSRKGRLEPRVVNLSDLTGDLSKSLPRMIGEDIRLSIRSGPRPCWVNVDPSLFHQAFMNLIINARDAMPNGGDLTIETNVMDLDAEFVHRHPGANLGQYAVISIEDTGIGMNEATQDRVFEPFFTTKQVGEGTGLGLSMVYGFVRQSGGFIECKSEPGKGTRFGVYFPRVDQAATETQTAAESREPLRGFERILVVEDEEPVRRMLVESLREGGYRVLETANSAEALPLGEHFEDPIDVLVTDIVMPGMSGTELAERIKATRPDIAILFVSGYAEDDLSRRGLDSDRGNLLLIKPFSHEALLRSVREVLAAAKGAS